ncbi:MAG: HAD-IB family phosphatase [Pseudomonadota bacterium]
MHRLVIYDMDKTITRKATYTAFLVHMALQLAPWRLLLAPVSAVFTLGYLLKMISRSRLKELNQALFIGSSVSLEKLQPHIQSYADKVLADNIQPGALRQIVVDKDAGCTLMMATASYELYVHAIAKRLGFDVVLGTKLMIDAQGRVRAQINGDNCYAEAKLARITAWQQDTMNGTQPLEIIRTYSDHVSDVPMLLLGSEAMAVNPHKPLADYAQAQGWRIVDWSH